MTLFSNTLTVLSLLSFGWPQMAQAQNDTGNSPPENTSSKGESTPREHMSVEVPTPAPKVQTLDIQKTELAGASSGPQGAALISKSVMSGKAAKEEQQAQNKAVRLMEFGITGGVAAVAQIPTGSDYGQSFAKVTSMPYVMLMPAFWGVEKESRKFCASQWGFGTQDKAHQAAIAMSRQWARRTIAAGGARLAAGVTVNALARDWAKLDISRGWGPRR